jgi:flagellar biosynthesis/type III secretory pathway protein FliH
MAAENPLYELSADERTRAEYEMHMRAVRDRSWLRNDGRQEGLEEGVQKGEKIGVQKGAQKLFDLVKGGKTLEEALAIISGGI